MADLNEIQSAQSVKIAGANPSTGVETYYQDFDSSGRASVKLYDASGNAITLGQKTSANSVPIAPSAEQTFITAALSTTIGLNKSMIALMNPIGSTVILKIREISVVNVRRTAVTGVVAEFQALRITSLTGGTAITPLSFDTQDTLGAGITSSTGGTVGGEAATPLVRVYWSSDEWGPGTLDGEQLEHAFQETTPFYIPRDFTKPITLRAGEGLTIKQITNSSNGSFDVTIIFTQEAS